MKNPKNNRKSIVTNKRRAAIILLAASFLFVSASLRLSDRDFQIVKNIDIFFSLFRELNLFYVDQPNPEQLISKGIEGMLETLDPYTVFIPESEIEEFKTSTTGQYGGVGMAILNIDNVMTVVEISQNSPAQKAGIRIGDEITKIDGKSVKDQCDDNVNEWLNGVPNTKLAVSFVPSSGMREATRELTRETITIPNVPYYGLLDEAGKTGYIRLSGFSFNAARETKEALTYLKQTYGIEELVLDLRNNPGGLLLEAVEVVNLFVNRGQEVVSTRGRIKQWDNVYTTRHEPVDTLISLAIIVNRLSASAAEIVAGAIQDLDRGIVVGQRTFGKGLVQATRPLSYNTHLKVTTARYYIPSGRCIQALDYAHREADGSVGYIPDSLIREFKTLKTNRTVRDGGGISPDVPVLPETISRIAVALFRQNLIFKYATLYANKHDSIAPAKKFQLTDEEYQEYIEFLHDKHFEYQTETEIALNRLIETATREKYVETAANELKALQTKLSSVRLNDLTLFKNDIKALLEEEISFRYYLDAGRVANTIRNDRQIQAAVDILREPNKYASLLNILQM